MPDLIQSLGNEMLLAISIAAALVTRQTYLWIKFGKIKFFYISAYDKLAFAACAFLSLFMSILLFTIPAKGLLGLLLFLIFGAIHVIIGDGIRQKGIISGSKWISWDRVTGYDVTDINGMKNIIIYTNKRNLIRKVVAIDWLLLEEKAERVTDLIDEHIMSLNN